MTTQNNIRMRYLSKPLQQKCRSYEYQVKMFSDHLELGLWSYLEKVVQAK